MRRLFNVVLVLGLVLTALPATAQDKLKIVASFSILGDMVRQVTGELASVTTIVGPDADAHVYMPNASVKATSVLLWTRNSGTVFSRRTF